MISPKVFAIHGVGDAVPGSVIKPLAKTLLPQNAALEQGTLIVAGHQYETLHTDSTSIAELNWSDIQRPRTGSIGLIRHILMLAAACLYLGDRWQGAGPSSRNITRLYRVYVETIMAWVVLLPPFFLLCTGLRGPGGERTPIEIAVVISYCLAIIALTYMSRRLPIFFRAGVVWSCIFLISGTSSLLFRAEFDAVFLGSLYARIQIVGGALLLLSLIDVLRSHRLACYPWRVRFARIGLLSFPVIVIASLGPLLLAVSTTLIPNVVTECGSGLLCSVSEWSEDFIFGYNLQFSNRNLSFYLSELFMTIAIGLIAFLGLLGVALYYRFQTGTFARSWMYLMLIASPIILMLSSLAIWLFPSEWESFHGIEEWSLVETYRFSALRILPILPFMIGPLLVLVDIVGDVAFYVLPKEHPFSTRSTATGRLKTLLSQIGPEVQEYTVYAHSQGSVIAVDTLAELADERAVLVTIGSPISSLYESFLDIKPGDGLPERSTWINFYRVGDYIGGSISRANIDQSIGPGGHTDYWNDTNFRQALNSALGKAV